MYQFVRGSLLSQQLADQKKTPREREEGNRISGGVRSKARRARERERWGMYIHMYMYTYTRRYSLIRIRCFGTHCRVTRIMLLAFGSHAWALLVRLPSYLVGFSNAGQPSRCQCSGNSVCTRACDWNTGIYCVFANVNHMYRLQGAPAIFSICSERTGSFGFFCAALCPLHECGYRSARSSGTSRRSYGVWLCVQMLLECTWNRMQQCSGVGAPGVSESILWRGSSWWKCLVLWCDSRLRISSEVGDIWWVNLVIRIQWLG